MSSCQDRPYPTGLVRPRICPQRTLALLGLVPAAVTGHSVGEFCAVVVAGVLTLEEAAGLIARRAALMQALPKGGLMAAVMAPEAWVTQQLAAHPEVSIAAFNGPRNQVISGPAPAVRDCLERFRPGGGGGQGAQYLSRLPLSAHGTDLGVADGICPQLAPAAAGLAHRLQSDRRSGGCLDLRRPGILGTAPREPVRFAAGCDALAKLGANVFVEIGPQPTLVNMARLCVDQPDMEWLTSLAGWA